MDKTNYEKKKKKRERQEEKNESKEKKAWQELKKTLNLHETL